MRKFLKIIGLPVFAAVWVLFPISGSAALVQEQNNVPEAGDFPVGPASYDIEAYPGQTVVKQIEVINRFGHIQNFHIEVEDFQGSIDDSNKSISLQGDKPGRYTARSWVRPEIMDFSLQHGEKQTFNVEVYIPEEAKPGDHYAAVLVSAPPEVDLASGQPNVVITSRIGVLFYITVRGDTLKQSGAVESFTSDKISYSHGPVKLTTVFRNDGNVRLMPSGQVKIYNSFGKVIDTIDIKRFNVLRESVAQNEIVWKPRGFLMGKYTAELLMYNGYTNEPELKTLTFLVIPWVFLIKWLIFIVMVVIVVKWLSSHMKLTIQR